jgi:hypothetical protein
MRARLVINLLMGSALAVVSSYPALADERPGGGAYVDENGDPTATAGDGAGHDGGGGSGGDDCEWRVWVEDDFEFLIWDNSTDPPTTMHSATGRWLDRICPGDGYDASYPEGGLVDPVALAQQALASVGIAAPVISTSPSAADRLYVQVPTWLWVDNSWWRPYEATARAGRVTSTVSARPVQTSWSLGDGTSVTCAGPGRPWQPGLAESSADCVHTYTVSSAGRPGGAFDLRATVTFAVSWSSNTGQGGTLPAISRTSEVAVRVGEIQAIGTR